MRNSKSKAIGITPYRLVYGKDDFLPLEITVAPLIVAKSHMLGLDEYKLAMLMELDLVVADRFAALIKMELSKIEMARSYNKHVRLEWFLEGDLVWKTILPIGIKDPKYGKWSPNWERIHS